jgi:hypothetical protein
MAGSMRTHTKGYYSSFILILLFSLTLFSCELFAPPQDQPEETEQEEVVEEIPPHPIVGYWAPTGTPEVVYRITGSYGINDIFFGDRTRIMTGDDPGIFYGGTIEIHGDIIKIWTGARYRMAPTFEYQIVITGDTMWWYQKYSTTIVSAFTRTEEVVWP